MECQIEMLMYTYVTVVFDGNIQQLGGQKQERK
jgi:hypothetical protein